MYKKILTYWIVFLLVTQNTYAYPMISENHQNIIKNAVNKVQTTDKIQNYLSKLWSIEGRIRKDKFSTYDYLLYKIEERGKEITKNEINNLSSRHDIISANDSVISDVYKWLAQRAKKIIKINDNFEFYEKWKLKKITPHLYIELNPTDAYIRTVLRTYDLENEVMLLKGNKFYFTVKWYTIEDAIDLEYLKKNAKKFITFSNQWNEEGLWSALLKIDNIDYFLDTTSYEYSYIPNKPFFLSSYANLENVSDWIVSLDEKTNQIRIYTEKANIYRFPFYVDKKLPNRSQNLSYLASDLMHYSTNKEAALKDDNAWQNLVNFTLDLVAWAKTEQEKVDIIYRWITANIKYDYNTYNYVVDNNIDLSKENVTFVNPDTFWWIKTFENKKWVCQGITKLFYYMLSIAGVKDIKTITWKANNEVVYIEHVWLKINGSYYDPTFDLWNGWRRPFMWKGLPEDIIMASRDYKDGYDYAKSDSDQLKEKYYSELKKVKEKYDLNGTSHLYPIFRSFNAY